MKSMDELTKEAIAVAQTLIKDDEGALYALIGRQEKAIERDPALAYDPALNPDYDGEHMGLIDDLKDLGKRIASKWARALHGIVCGAGKDAERDQLAAALNVSEAAAIAAVTGLLMPIVSPPIAAAVAVVIVKKFLVPAGGVACDFWEERLEAG